MSNTARHDQLAPAWSPTHFLGALGAGGLAVSFFMYILFMTKHAGQPIPSFATLSAEFATGSLAMQALIAASVTGIAVFSVLHVILLVWNIQRFSHWHASDNAQAMRTTNTGSSLMAAPLTYAMSINVGFIVGAVFVPGLWQVVEYLFPLAILAFAAVGIYAMQIFSGFMTTMIVDGGFDVRKNNSLAQMLSVFAFAMVGVGFSAPVAMSHNTTVQVIGFMGAAFFIVAAIVFGLVFLIMGMASLFENKANPETVPTLWIGIPILTIIGIALYRMNMSLAHNFETPWAEGSKFMFLTAIFSLQLVFAVIGWAVMKRTRYFETYVTGPQRSPGSLALVCPGVALFVFANFLVNYGLVGIGAVDKFGAVYIALYVPMVALQAVTILAFLRLTAKLVTRDTPVPGRLAAAE